MVLHIKNMVCNHSLMVVTDELKKLDLPVMNVSLGKVVLARPLHIEEKRRLQERLANHGYELLDNKKSPVKLKKVKSALLFLVKFFIPKKSCCNE